MNLRLRSIVVLSFFLLASSPAGFAFAQKANLNMPNVSANALILFRNSNFNKEDTSIPRNGLDLREAEIAYFADVDPDNRLNVLLAVRPEYSLNAGRIEQTWKTEPEEFFVENIQIPLTTVRVGKFKAALGKHNPLHTHAFPFIERPLVNQGILGNEGLGDVGASAAILMPAPWFSELTAQFLRGEGENVEFNSPSAGDGVGVARWKNLFDLSEALTFEVGVSYAQGGNNFGGTTRISGADLTFKWRPVEGGKYRSWILALEGLQSSAEQGAGVNRGERRGWHAWGQYQFAERWAFLVRDEAYRTVDAIDPSDVTNTLPNTTNRRGIGLVFNGSEFSSYKLQYDMAHGPANTRGETDERQIFLQGNFTMGAHPAHAY